MSSGRLARWSLLLQGYKFEIRYKKGTTNVLANALLRRVYDPPPPIHPDDDILNDDDFIATVCENMCTDTNKEEIFFEYNNDTDQTYNDTNSQSLLTITNINELQKNCEDLKDLINYIAHRELPDNDKTARRIIFESEQYIFENDTHFHLYQPRINIWTKIIN